METHTGEIIVTIEEVFATKEKVEMTLCGMRDAGCGM